MARGSPFRSDGKFPTWLEVGTRIRVIANSNEHSYALGSEVVVAEIDASRGAFRARKLDSGEIGNWLVSKDVARVAELGWRWLTQLLPPEDVALLEAFDGLDTLELKGEVKAELIKQVADLKAAILIAVRSK